MKNDIDNILNPKLTKYQKKILFNMAMLNYHIIEIIDLTDNNYSPSYTLSDAENDYITIRSDTMEALKKVDYMLGRALVGCESVLRTKYYIPEEYKTEIIILSNK